MYENAYYQLTHLKLHFVQYGLYTLCKRLITLSTLTCEIHRLLLYPSTNIHQTMRFLLITAQISKIFLGASPQDPLIYPSCLHSTSPPPHIYPSCLHSTSPPYISFQSTFTKPQDFSSL